jgi:tRNA G18 (ribose-2'-O)-methylase SpoU
MMLERIRRTDDPRVALFRAVSDPDLARSHGVFVAEGRLVVRRVLEDPRYRIRSLLLNAAAHRDLEPLLARRDHTYPVLLCETGDFRAITGFHIHRGCLALVERPPATSADDVIAAAARCLLLLDGIANADNVGGVFRNGAAFGADAVLLSPDSCDPLYRKAIRTSMAAVLRVPFARSHDWRGDLVRVRDAGFTIVALTPRAPSMPLDEFAATARGTRLAIVAGGEGSGVSALVESVADVRVRIPIASDIDSLNVAVAVGIALYRLRMPPQSAQS